MAKIRCTRERLLGFLNVFYSERSTALQWQVFQAAMDAGLENCDLLREVFVEHGGHVAVTPRGITEWRWGGRGGGSSTQHNLPREAPPPDDADSHSVIAWMARQRRTRSE